MDCLILFADESNGFEKIEVYSNSAGAYALKKDRAISTKCRIQAAALLPAARRARDADPALRRACLRPGREADARHLSKPAEAAQRL
jgi:hypothetical protein